MVWSFPCFIMSFTSEPLGFGWVGVESEHPARSPSPTVRATIQTVLFFITLLGSIQVEGFAAGPAAGRHPRVHVDRLADEPDGPVHERDVRPARMEARRRDHDRPELAPGDPARLVRRKQVVVPDAP